MLENSESSRVTDYVINSCAFRGTAKSCYLFANFAIRFLIAFAKLVNSHGICNSLNGEYLESYGVKRYQFWLEIKIFAST